MAEISCQACGNTQDAGCDCGASYVPLRPRERALAAIAKCPEKSLRAIAEEIGVHHTTVKNAKDGMIVEKSTNVSDLEPPYVPNQPWEEQAEIVAFRKAFYKLGPFQRAYAWKHVLPNYNPGNIFHRRVS